MKPAACRRYDRFLFAMCGLAGLLYGIDVGLISAALPYIQATTSFTEKEVSTIVAAVLLGAIPGSFVAAFVAEKWGRLTAFRLTAVFFAVAVPFICFSGGHFVPMFAGRILQGVGCGIAALAAPLYLTECADPAWRGRGAGMIQIVTTGGLVLAALIGYAVTVSFGPAESALISLGAKTAAWQTIFWFSFVPTVFLFAGTFRLRESPRWLFKVGRKADAERSLLANNTPGDARFVMEEMERNAAAAREAAKAASATRETLLQRKYVLPFLLSFAVMSLTQVTGINSVNNYSVVILKKAGLADSFSNLADVAIKFALFAFTFIALALVDRKGRKFLLSLGTAGVVAGLAIVGAVFWALERGLLACGPLSGWLVTAGFVVYIAFFSVGPGVCVWLANSELMPIRIRANGMMINGFGNSATSWMIAQAFLPWSAAHGESSVFFALAAGSFVFFLVAAFLLPETKGRSLEEIERYFTRKQGTVPAACRSVP